MSSKHPSPSKQHNNKSNSPLDPNTIINDPMASYMKSILKINASNNEYKDSIFTKDALECVNSSVHNSNYYILDRYGLPIRKNSQDSKKTAFGWRYDSNNEPLNIHIPEILLQTESPDIQTLTLQQLKQSFPTLFKPPRGIIYKIYATIYPDFKLEDL